MKYLGNWSARGKAMREQWLRLVTSRPWLVVGFWLAATLVVTLLAPDLSRLAAEGQAKLTPEDSEGYLARELIGRAWPDQAYMSAAVVVLHRAGGLTEGDRVYGLELSRTLNQAEKPAEVVRILGPESAPEIADFLRSGDGTSQILVAQMSTSFVAPATHDAVAKIQAVGSRLQVPAGLEVLWTGDAVFGRDYMRKVQVSLDRAAVVTVVLLLIVLLVVYRSLLLAVVPLVTIGVGLLISRGVLAWMTQAGWDMSPLVELFLVVILFGCGTDFCLLLSWRYGEHWNASNPERAMRRTLERVMVPLLTSAGTVIIGLLLMGFTRFKLFSATGPSVGLGLALTVMATLTLSPALLILVTRWAPWAFRGLTSPSMGWWDRVGKEVLKRPARVWLCVLLVMAVPAGIGLASWTVQDLVAEMPSSLESVRGMGLVSEKYGAGRVAPLTVVIRSEQDLRGSEGLALIDDISRILSRQRFLKEVRSATQPLGSSRLLEPARLDSRLTAVRDGFGQMVEGGTQLQEGLREGAAKLKTAMMLEDLTGVKLTGNTPEGAVPSREAVVSGLVQVTGSLFGGGRVAAKKEEKAGEVAEPAKSEGVTKAEGGGESKDERPANSPQGMMLKELTRAAEGAGQIVDGAKRARDELTGILTDPVGLQALDRLLVTSDTVRENPDLLRSFEAYIDKSGKLGRIDLVQDERLFSPRALDQVELLRTQLKTWLKEMRWVEGKQPLVMITGTNAESADVRSVTTSDQRQAWLIVPLGVFLVLLVALRDPLACVNLVATMILTYAFALGVTHAVFVWGLGASGIDWKVPYFLFVLLVAVGVDYNVFLMTRLQEEAGALGLRLGTIRAIAQTGGLISSAAAITACSFASFLCSPLSSLRQLGFALIVGIVTDAVLVRPVLVPCGHWLMNRKRKPPGIAALPMRSSRQAELAGTRD